MAKPWLRYAIPPAVLASVVIGAVSALAQPTEPSRPLSPIRDFRGVYVTNFEIGYFFECDLSAGGCDDWVHQEPRWLVGAPWPTEVAFQQCIARWNGSRDRWAMYAVDFRGQETLDRRPMQTMHDTERRVSLNAVTALEMIGTDETITWALPRYRHQPRLAC